MFGTKDILRLMLFVFVFFGFSFWRRGECIDEISAFAPDGLEATLEPGEFPHKAIIPELTEQTLDIG